jgi:acetyl-CoA carboxylase carboxyl transferase subunit alpha
MAALPTPIVAAVVGEGGSGGALALGTADRILMFENSVYSVISPEGCAAILWKDATQRERAAAALKLTASDLLEFKLIDEIVPEPVGGAHLDPDTAGETLRATLIRHVNELRKVRPEKLVRRRGEKFAAMGAYAES